MKQKPIRDSVGREIPFGLIELWGRRQEVETIVDALCDVKAHIIISINDGDMLFKGIDTTLPSALNNVIEKLLMALPYAVCPDCQGHPESQPKGHCRMCSGRGLISKFLWNNTVTEEKKKIIEKGTHK